MNQTKQMVRMAVLATFGVILFYYVAFPLPFFPPFLTYDAGDIPGIIAAFTYGPWAGLLVQFLKALIGLLVGASKAGWIGALANFLAGGTMSFAAGLVYYTNKTRKMAILSLFVGCIATTLVMGVANYYWLLPLWNVPANQILPMLTAAVLPFNFVKFALSSLVTFFLYKKVKNFLEVEEYRGVEQNK